jgi:hypothetical protein
MVASPATSSDPVRAEWEAQRVASGLSASGPGGVEMEMMPELVEAQDQ